MKKDKKWLLYISLSMMTLMLILMILMNINITNSTNSSTSTSTKNELLVMLDWTPNTNHTGIYVAQNLGFYKDLGLNVKILQSGKLSTMKLIDAKQIDIGISHQESLVLARASGIKAVSIAAIVQENTSGFYARETSGIKTPKDFEGKTYGSWNSPIEHKMLETVMKSVQADPNLVKHVGIGELDFFSIQNLGIDFASGYEAWTGMKAKVEGIKTVYFPVRDYSDALNTYTPILVVHEDFIKTHENLITKFMDATTKGYEYSIQNPELSALILIKEVPELDKNLILESQKYLSPRYKGNQERIQEIWGFQDIKVFERYNNWLLENNIIEQNIEQNIEAKKMFTNQFLSKQFNKQFNKNSKP